MTDSITSSRPPVLIVHGGAYDIPVETHDVQRQGCQRAAQVGWETLSDGGLALDAVEAAVRVLEDDPNFDAGYGSFLNAEGVIQMDAIIMDGRDLNFGAVAAVQRVRYPVTLARRVMTDSQHAFLVGRGADAFAVEQGMATCTPGDMCSPLELERWQGRGTYKWDGTTLASDTVGAVAMDSEGNLAVATSTGGTFNKHVGRVGDSPLVGCGGYADNRVGAVSATGMGESLMRIVASKTTCELMAAGKTAQEAADAVIALLSERTTGQGGVIVLDRAGRIGVAHSTSFIAFAYVTSGGEIVTGIERA